MYIILYYILLYYTILYYTILYYIILYYIILYYIILCIYVLYWEYNGIQNQSTMINGLCSSIPSFERSTEMGFHSSLQDRFFPSPIATQSDSLDLCTCVKHRPCMPNVAAIKNSMERWMRKIHLNTPQKKRSI